jgi:hypothetical protein
MSGYQAWRESSILLAVLLPVSSWVGRSAGMTAVDAAQAGKARPGSAVMADEVRILASRTADAAKNTSNPAEISVKAVKKRHDPDPIAPERFQG